MFTPAPSEAKHLSLEVRRTSDGRLEGQVRSESATAWRSFSGVLEFLKVIEELIPTEDPDSPTPNNTKEIGQ
jgi:hypothetical protein